MIRSKTRSECFDFKQKSNLFSRTLSSSKLCRRDDIIEAQINANALQSIDKNSSSKNRAERITMQQQQMGEMEEELVRTREQLDLGEREKRRILDQLKDANRALSSSTHSHQTEIESLQVSLSISQDESKEKDRKIDHLETELQKSREIDSQRLAYLDSLNSELHESRIRIEELEDELQRRKELESRMADNLISRAKQLDMTTFYLEESKIELIALHEKIESLEQENFQEDSAFREQEVESLKNERRLAVEAEEKSAKAMEDLALALKEVATESNEAKEKLKDTQVELERARAEAGQLKKIVRESQQECELHKNMAKRLRLEAEETLLALSEKEMGFVSCIKLAEEEKAKAQSESLRLTESVKAAREETSKLRDILREAVNEANAANAAAGIARDENSLLKDSLSEMEEKLNFLNKENERLRKIEDACNRNMKQLKILLSRCSEEFDGEGNVMVNKNFSFNLEDLRFVNEAGDMDLDEGSGKAETLKGSIFDGKTNDSDSDLDSDRGSHRSAKTMFQRVGDLLLVRRVHHRKDPSEHADTTHPDSN